MLVKLCPDSCDLSHVRSYSLLSKFAPDSACSYYMWNFQNNEQEVGFLLILKVKVSLNRTTGDGGKPL